MTAFAGLVFHAWLPKKDREPDCSTQQSDLSMHRAQIDAHSECEWKQGHDEASEMVAPLTAAHLTNVGLLMEAGETPELHPA